jgi:hypothetical protein
VNSKIFIPKKIKVGYQERSDTYTGKLAYVIYYDEKGKLRKETSWESWRKESLEPNDYENEPTYGFVLNKKAGGYSTGWNHRQTYCRIYDPRGFEFEITIPNLLYILDNCNSIKGKGLEGNFVYGWEGTKLLLIPENSPDYKELTSHSKTIYENKKFNVSNMIVGATYTTRQNEKWVYLGRYNLYEDSEWRSDVGKNKGKYYYFFCNGVFNTIKSIENKIVDIFSQDCVDNYSDLMTLLENRAIYSPHDHYRYIEITTKEDAKDISYLYVNIDQEFYGLCNGSFLSPHGMIVRNLFEKIIKKHYPTIEDVLGKVQLYRRVRVLKNGNTGE